jgi:hypothetical protein
MSLEYDTFGEKELPGETGSLETFMRECAIGRPSL